MTHSGTPYYFSPELCQNKPYNNKSDVWALGCILYEITTLQHAFEGQNMKVLMQKIVRGVYPPISNDYTKHLRDLIKSMLMRESRDRPSINAVTRLPYLQGYICTLGKILGENIQEHKSLVSDEVKLAARMEARDRALVNEKERRAKAIDKLQQKDAVVMRDVDEIRKMKADEDKRLAQRMEKMRAEQQVRMKEIQKREMELERQRREQQAEAQKRNEIEKEKQRKVREEEMGKWRERKKQEQKVYEEQEAKRQQLNRIREEKWEKQMQEMEVAAKQRAARESELREEERAKAAGRAFWEVRNAAQQNKLRVENEVQRKSEALHSPTPDSPQPREPSCCGDHHQSPKKRLSEAELLKQQRDAFLVMKREAARNKANLEAGLFEAPARQSNSPAHASHHVSNSPARVQRDNSKRQNSEPTPEERKAAFLEMRREAQRNKLRMEAEMRGGSPSTPSPAEEEAPPPSSPAEAPPPSSPAPASNQDECGDLTEWVNNEAVSEAEVGQDEWVGDYKDMVCHIEALKSSATIARLDDEEFGDSPDEGVNGSGIPQKFQIDGKTLNLPNVKASDPLMYRIEALRMYVSEEISEDNFVKAYKMMVDVEEDANDQVIQEVEHLLGSKPHVMQLISQLIFCEDQFNLEQNKPP
ncbi:putative serine/threonine-protein kinase nek3 [Diplonema papillatum]|nr:putative serine/threonine-protein kinase nek3 [Diplonema papillatum]